MPDSLASTEAFRVARYIYIVVLLLGAVVQSTLCGYALWFSGKISTKRRNSKHIHLLAVGIMIWILYTASAMIRTWGISHEIRHDGQPLAGTLSFWVLGVGSIFTIVYVLLGDLLMLWRCYAVWNGHRWILAIPSAFCAASLCFGILCFTPLGKSMSQSNPAAQLSATLWAVLSACSNLIITILLVVKLLAARRRELDSKSEGGEYPVVANLYRALIFILVESAAPLALASLCLVVGSAAALSCGSHDEILPGLGVFMLLAQAFFLFFGAISPQLILFRTLVIVPETLAEELTVRRQSEEFARVYLSTIHIHTTELPDNA